MTDAVPTRLAFREALAAVLDGVVPLGGERVALLDAVGRALAEDAISPLDLPQWDNSAMDGYAVRATDVVGASGERPVTLHVVGESAAGDDLTGMPAVAPGQAVRISTGARVPDGSDAVVRVEDTTLDGAMVRILADRDAVGDTAQRRNVRPRGEDVRAGTTVLARGTTIGPAAIGVLASVGYATVPVIRRPRVAIVSSGNELATVDDFARVLAGERIVSSNDYALAAQVREAGGLPTDGGFVRDDRDALGARLRAVLDGGCDVLVTSGGISVGEHDHTRDALASLGITPRFWRARIRPGGPIGFGVARVGDRDVAWLGLPGNPVSAMVTFELFGRPLLRRLGGHARIYRRTVPVIVGETIRTAAPLTHFLRATLDVDGDGRLVATLTGAQGSNLLTSMARADALLVVPEDAREVAAGATLSALLLGGDDTERAPA